MTIPDIQKKSLLDEFPELREEMDVPESGTQHDLARYLENLLEWYYRAQNWYVSGNIYIVQKDFRPISPDVFLIKQSLTQTEKDAIESWDLRQSVYKTPAVIFEIASAATWPQDLEQKVERYRQMGVDEYFAYDPNTPQLWADKTTRLKGWRYQNQTTQTLTLEKQGWLKSESLQLLLVPDKKYLRLHNLNGNPILSPQQEVEFEKQAKWHIEQQLKEAESKVQLEYRARETERLTRERVEAENKALRAELEKLRRQSGQN